jgi:hypothetical protein
LGNRLGGKRTLVVAKVKSKRTVVAGRRVNVAEQQTQASGATSRATVVPPPRTARQLAGAAASWKRGRATGLLAIAEVLAVNEMTLRRALKREPELGTYIRKAKTGRALEFLITVDNLNAVLGLLEDRRRGGEARRRFALNRKRLTGGRFAEI